MEAQREEREAERKSNIKNQMRMMEEIFAKMDLKANPEERQTVGENQMVPKEEASVMPLGEPRKRCRNRNLAAELWSISWFFGTFNRKEKLIIIV
jgi:hypothetical protein